jgi:hypothetical protein
MRTLTKTKVDKSRTKSIEPVVPGLMQPIHIFLDMKQIVGIVMRR